jgi:predicted dithiol-disulfide oxidoreductase (DUF899 family)
MGWSFPWVSSADSDFSFDFGFARTEEQTREMIAPWADTEAAAVPRRIARAVGTDLVGFMTDGPGFLAFAKEDGIVYLTYSTGPGGSSS